MGLTILTVVETKSGKQFEIPLPAKRIVCPSCDGCGTELYGGMRGAVFSGEEMSEDHDFRESYFRGDYDVACSRCSGKNVVLAVDEAALSPKMLERYLRAQDSKAQSDAEAAAERRYFERGA